MARLATRAERQKWWDSLTDEEKDQWYAENFKLKEACELKSYNLISLYRQCHFGSIRRVINGKRECFIMPQDEMVKFGFSDLRFKLQNLGVEDKPWTKDTNLTWKWSHVRLTISELKEGKIVKNHRYDMSFNLDTENWSDKEDSLMGCIEDFFYTMGGYHEFPVGLDDDD